MDSIAKRVASRYKTAIEAVDEDRFQSRLRLAMTYLQHAVDAADADDLLAESVFQTKLCVGMLHDALKPFGLPVGPLMALQRHLQQEFKERVEFNERGPGTVDLTDVGMMG